MTKYVFPAIFTPEGNGYTIDFPDVLNCYTEGDDLTQAMENAKDVLCMMLYNLEKDKKEIPVASNIADIQKRIKSDEFVTLVACDTMEYRKFYEKKAVKKTLSIPSWLNEYAEQAGINFSATLQEALKRELGI